MAIRVLVIGQHDPDEGTFTDIVNRVGKDTETFMSLRCSTPGDFFDKVRSAVRALNGRISVLDLFDHGANGRQLMGDPRKPALFSADGDGFQLASQLANFLTNDAQVRLLGCETARGLVGKKLLVDLQKAFGKSIVVQGTLQAVSQNDFAIGGFKLLREDKVLFSSTEAAALAPNARPPTYDERNRELLAWRRQIG